MLNAPRWNKRVIKNQQQRFLDIAIVLSSISSDFTRNFITKGTKFTALFMLLVQLHKWELQNATQCLQDANPSPPSADLGG